MSQQQNEAAIVPIVRINPNDARELIKLISQSGAAEAQLPEGFKREEVDAALRLQAILSSLISATTSDIVIPPTTGELALLTDAMIGLQAISGSLLMPMSSDIVDLLESGQYDEVMRRLNSVITMKRIAYAALMKVLTRRLNHIYYNLPPGARPSLVNPMLGHEKIE